MPQALYGLVGRTLSHSWSPQIHQLIMTKLGMDGRYNLYPMEPESLGGFIRAIGSAANPCGVNVTIPYKQAVVELLDSVSKEAAVIGAVNTIALVEGRLMGYNTDYYGFKSSLERQGIDISGKRALILGSGGSARTSFAVLCDMGAEKIYIASRSPEKAAMEFECADVVEYEKVNELNHLKLLVNTTPAGMHGFSESTAIPGDRVPYAEYTFDLVYNPMNTPLLKIAAELGSKTQNGLYMLVAQAAKAQEIWREIHIPRMTMDEVYHEIREIMSNA